MLKITQNITIADEELELVAIRAQGSGGQNVNKVSSAIHLRFDIKASSLPEVYKERLLALSDKRITKEGVVVIKAQQHRTQEKNRADALARLLELVKSILYVERVRRPTKPSQGSQKRRRESNEKRSNIKALRRKVEL